MKALATTSRLRCFCSLLALSAALLVGLVHRLSSLPPDVVVDVRHPSRPPASVRPLTPDEVASYRRDGVLLARNLISEEDAALLAAEADGELGRRAPWTLFELFTHLYSKVVFDAWRMSEAYASLALVSLPPVAAQLLLGEGYRKTQQEKDGESESENKNKLRLLRDAYFAHAPGGRGCGWHVDDEGFWPTEKTSSGVTIWIALDPMLADEGGGLAVVNATKVNEEMGEGWAQGCRIGRTLNFKGRTCDMETERPDCHEGMERFGMRWNVRPGDAIIWDRWTYHRGVPFVRDDDDDSEGKKKRRYSVRYMPADSRAAGIVHSSVDQGSVFDSSYYPQVWPETIDEEVEALRKGLDGDATLLNIFRSIVPVARQFYSGEGIRKG